MLGYCKHVNVDLGKLKVSSLRVVRLNAKHKKPPDLVADGIVEFASL